MGMSSGESVAGDESVVLAVETAGRGGTVCLVQGDKVLARAAGDPNISHSNSLLRDIQQCLDAGGVSLRDVDLFAAASGPGSFTGLRIGIATVKALSVTLDKPCIGVPTLHAVAHSAGPSSATVALLPAGRGELFVQLLSVSSSGVVIEVDGASHLLPQRVMEKYGSSVQLKWVGPGAHFYRGLIVETARANEIEFSENGERRTMEGEQQGWVLVPEQEQLARNVAALAVQQFQAGHDANPQALSAIYVRPSDAELKCK